MALSFANSFITMRRKSISLPLTSAAGCVIQLNRLSFDAASSLRKRNFLVVTERNTVRSTLSLHHSRRIKQLPVQDTSQQLVIHNQHSPQHSSPRTRQ
jgi:hypothetical protein